MQRTNTKSNYVCKYQKRKLIIRVRYISVTLRLKDNTIYVRPVKVAPGLIGKMLHQWNLQVTYQTLTLEEIQSSVNRADATNLLHDCDVMKSYVTNFVTEQLANPQEE